MTFDLKPEEKLKSEVQKDVDRLEKAKKEKRTLLAQTVYLGTLGLMLALPIVGGPIWEAGSTISSRDIR